MHEGHRERMRDRLFTDPDQISDHELLEILLYYCIIRKNTNPVAHDLLDAFCDLQGVFSAPPLQGGGHRFKSCTAHQGNQGVTAYAVPPFFLYTLFCTHAAGVGMASMAAVFWSLRTCW